MPAEIILSQSAIIAHLAKHFREREGQSHNNPALCKENRGIAAILEAHKDALDSLLDKIA